MLPSSVSSGEAQPSASGIVAGPLSPKREDLVTYAQAALLALAREELAGRRPRRLLEENRATWSRFRGRLDSLALLELLLEDAAVTQPSAFSVTAVFQLEDPIAGLPGLSAELVEEWFGALSGRDLNMSSADYIVEQAKHFGVTTRMARSELHKVESHQRVLELPGTGGQLAFHIVSTQPDVRLRDNFTIACATWQERALAGLIAVECGVAGQLELENGADLETLRSRKFDQVVFLDPRKGGPFTPDEKNTHWFLGAVRVAV